MTKRPHSALYFGHVMHARLQPFVHRFRYRVFSMLLDIDRLQDVSRGTRLFSHNKANLFSFFDKDHGPKDGSPLRPWVDDMLHAANIEAEGRVQLLCYPRVFGYVFNPLSVYYCHHKDGTLAAIIYEVSNTFGESHCYVARVQDQTPGAVVNQSVDKRFYVSPFIEVDGGYKFRFNPPGEDLHMHIRQVQDDATMMIAAFDGERKALSDRHLLSAFMRYPLMTVKVIAAIHWQALKIWRKGAKLVDRPDAPDTPITLAHGSPQPHHRA